MRSPWTSFLLLNSVRFYNSNGPLVKVKVSASSAKLCREYFQSWRLISASNFLDLSIYVSPSVISHLSLHLEAIYEGDYHLALGLSFAYVHFHIFYHTPDRFESSPTSLPARFGIGFPVSRGGIGVSHITSAIITHLGSLGVTSSSLRLQCKFPS